LGRKDPHSSPVLRQVAFPVTAAGPGGTIADNGSLASGTVQAPRAMLVTMRKTYRTTGWLLAAAALAAGPAVADSFRCGTKLITDGDGADKVRSLCGPPTEVTRSEVWRRPVLWRFGRPYYLSDDPVPVAVEYWTYNLGPNKLMRRLRLEDGVVTEIETLGHGYR
jgi:hypothetical protein